MDRNIDLNHKNLRIIIASDNHGHHELLKSIMEYEKKIGEKEGKSLLFLHAGDSSAKYEDELEGWLSVKGNMDFCEFLPFYRIIPLGMHKIFLTHGHLYSNASILNIMEENKCDICITGHTHVPFIQNKNGMYFINPGSTSRPRFASKKQYVSLDIDDDGNIKITSKFIEEIF